MAQTFTIASSGDYGLSWLDNAHQQYGPLTSYVVQIVSSPDHSLVWSETLTPTLDMWASRSAQMALVNGQYTISFTPTDLGWQADRLIDNVVLVAVPEPSTFAMSAVLVLPFGMLVVRHLRQRAKTA